MLISAFFSEARDKSRSKMEQQTPTKSSGEAAGGPSETTSSGPEEDPGDAAQENDMKVIQSELGFMFPLLIESPKCYWIWNYRAWILQQAIERLEVSKARKVWEDELGLASKMLTKDQRNFHAWGYRRHVVKKLESTELNGTSLVEPEFEYTSRMIHKDLSNFSAWHNRSNLIPRLLDERGASAEERRAFFDKGNNPSPARCPQPLCLTALVELALVQEALNVGPEDQSLWYYHQFLMQDLTNFVGRATITPNFSDEDRVTYLTREIQNILDLLEDYHDIKWIYETLLEYSLSLCQLEGREPQASEKEDLEKWLSKLRTLDPMRNGRWLDLEKDMKLG